MKELSTKGLALVMIDMQNDFVSWTINAKAIIPGLRRVLDSFRANNVPVVHVIRHYREDGSDVEVLRLDNFLKKPFVVAGTPGAGIVVELQPWEGEPVIIKMRWSAFFKTDFRDLLKEWGIGTIVVGGIFTPNCVRATVYDAVANDLNVVVLADGTASEDIDVQAANMLDMVNIGVRMMTCDDVLKIIDHQSKA